MRNIETFPSMQMYLYLSLVARKVAEFYHNMDERRYLVWFNQLVSINILRQLLVSLCVACRSMKLCFNFFCFKDSNTQNANSNETRNIFVDDWSFFKNSKVQNANSLVLLLTNDLTGYFSKIQTCKMQIHNFFVDQTWLCRHPPLLPASHMMWEPFFNDLGLGARKILFFRFFC